MTGSRGFTLVELMVSMGLFGLIAAGALSLVMSGNRLQAHSARVDVAQTAVRAALDFMSRDIVGASAGASSGTMVLGASGATQLPITVADSSSGPDAIDLWLADGSGLATVMQTVTTTSPQIVVDAVPPTLSVANPLFMVTDLSSATILNATGIGSTVVGAISYGAISVAQPNSFPAGVGGYAPQSYVFPVRHVTYSVSASFYGAAPSAAQDESLLMMDLHPNGVSSPQPLAEGVEDLQIALGFDNNSDGVVTEVGAAPGDDEWVFNVAGETAPPTLANLALVRITIVGKATLAEGATYSTRPQAEDRPAGTADGFPRRMIRTQLTVRNFKL